MLKYKTFTLIMPVVFGVTALLVVPKSQLQTSLSKTVPTTVTRKVDLNRFPVVEFSASETKDAKRKARSEKRNKSRFMVDPETTSERTVLVDSIDSNLPAFPIKEATAVVIGTVTKAQAHLSNDKSGVYSEFTTSIEEILKNPGKLVVGGLIEAERNGGRVKLPSGRLHLFKVSEHDMPRIGGRYVLFLAATDTESVFEIITGYEIREGLVYPLDELPPMRAYENTPATEFLNQLRTKLIP